MNRLHTFFGSVWNFTKTRTPQQDAVGNNVDARAPQELDGDNDTSRSDGLVSAPNPSTPSTPALKNAEDMEKKLDSSLPLSSNSGLPAESASAAVLLRAEAAEQQLADLQKQNAALKTELDKAIDAAQAEVQRLTTALEEAKSQGAMHQLQLKAPLAATEEAVAQGQQSEQHFAKWQFLDDCLQPLKQLDDTALMEEFKKFAAPLSHSHIQTDPDNVIGAAEEASTDETDPDNASEEASTDALDHCRLSGQGLAALFAAQNKALSDAEVEELMLRISTDRNGEIDWLKFRALVRSSSELEMIFNGLPVERVLASCFPRGTADDPLEAFFGQQHSDVVAAVLKAGHILVAMVAALITKHNEAREKVLGAGGAKYRGEFKGATVEKFFEGVTGICGEPHPGV
jgi:hypothetical protein